MPKTVHIKFEVLRLFIGKKISLLFFPGRRKSKVKPNLETLSIIRFRVVAFFLK
jgi:hypothetical protein